MHRLIRLGAVLLVAIVVSACGGSASGGNPGDTVRQAFRLVDEGNLDGLTDLACEAEKANIREQFDLGAGLAGLPAGFDMEGLLDAINMDTSKLTIGDANIQGDSATVQLGGEIEISFDQEKMRDVMREVLEAQGQPVDDASLNLAIAAMGSFSQAVPVDETVDLVREGGAWKICGDLNITG